MGATRHPTDEETPVIIRELRPADLTELLRLYQQLNPDDPVPDPLQARAVWDQIESDHSLFYFGGFTDSTLVATCNLAVIPNLTRSCRSFGVMENVVTDQPFRHQGYGQQVVAAALAKAWEMGCYKVMLQTSRKTDAVLGFYRACGFSADEKQAFIARRPPP